MSKTFKVLSTVLFLCIVLASVVPLDSQAASKEESIVNVIGNMCEKRPEGYIVGMLMVGFDLEILVLKEVSKGLYMTINHKYFRAKEISISPLRCKPVLLQYQYNMKMTTT